MDSEKGISTVPLQRSQGARDLPVCCWAFLGLVDYQEAWDLQRAIARARAEGSVEDTLLLLEHPPTYTLGRRSNASDLLLPREALEAQGAQVVDVDRGGEITFHGPGQLAGYPIVNLRDWGGPLRYVRALEAVIISTLDTFGVRAGAIEGLTGAWVGSSKIAAIGVRISRGITTHGFALNVATDLAWFRHIVPCGTRDLEVISLEQLLGRSVSLEEVAPVVAQCFGHELGFQMRKVAPETVLASGLLAPAT